MSGEDRITLKFGTWKSCRLTSERGRDLLRRYVELGTATSAICVRDTPEQKELICQMIDECNAPEIFLESDGIYVSKEVAKQYVMDYVKLR